MFITSSVIAVQGKKNMNFSHTQFYTLLVNHMLHNHWQQLSAAEACFNLYKQNREYKQCRCLSLHERGSLVQECPWEQFDLADTIRGCFFKWEWCSNGSDVLCLHLHSWMTASAFSWELPHNPHSCTAELKLDQTRWRPLRETHILCF